MTAIATRAAPPRPIRESSRRVLVVVDEACTSPALSTSVRGASGKKPTETLVIAPVHSSAATRWYVDEDAARADATSRLRACAASLTRDEIQPRLQLADPDPVQAIADALQDFPADEILLVTAPERPSTRLHRNVIDRARRRFQQPIEHVVTSTTPQGEPTWQTDGSETG